MAQTTNSSENRENAWLSARVDPELNRYIGMRASQLGMAKSEYILSLVREDLEDVDYAEV